MKVGLSFSRCVRDIVDGKVDINDVLIVIARTNVDPRNSDQWQNIWVGYRIPGSGSYPEWSDYEHEDEDRFRNVSIELWESGKLHQPRQFGAYPIRLPYYWLDLVLPSEELDKNPALAQAWENFQVIAALSGVTLIDNI